MRPNTVHESSGRPVSAGPTTFFLASESDIDRRNSAVSLNSESPASHVRRSRDKPDDSAAATKTSPGRASYRDGSRRRSTIRPRSTEDLRNEILRVQSNQSGSQQHNTSPNLNPTAHASTSSQEPSLPSSPKSLSSPSVHRSSEDELTQDGISSQAIDSDDEEHMRDSETGMHDSAPQLIMPSIRMPSRRPFTERGKQLGKFKILVAGNKSSGKTSLIKSIVQLCEDIIHVDPFTSNITPQSKPTSRNIAHAFRETYASTKPYPAWWSDLDESRILKRRKSMGDMVLERNICFVDSEHTRPPAFAVNYIEQQLHTTINCANQASAELTRLLSGSGGSQVDLVLYLITQCKFLCTG